MLNNFWKKYCFPVVFFLAISCPIFASDEDVHNSQLLRVLFGRAFTINYNEQRYIEPLTKALYLSIDLYNGQKLYYLDDLRLYGVQNLPSAQQIDFTSNLYHQRETHRGWDFLNYNNQILWEIRKQLLLSTIEKIFNFQPNEMIKKDSFAALLYYTHILGDHAGDSKLTYTDRMRINGSIRGRTIAREDIVWELEYHLERLFREQTNTFEYRMLKDYLNKHRFEPSFEYAQKISDEDFSNLQLFSKDILDKLAIYIPPLLKKETFFNRVFL